MLLALAVYLTPDHAAALHDEPGKPGPEWQLASVSSR